MKNRRTPIAAAAVAMALLCALPAAAQAAGSAYVTAAGPGTGPRPGLVDQYTIASGNGVLSPKNPFTAPTGDVPGLIAVTPDGKSVYVGNGNDANISQYDVDAASGLLSPKNPPTVAAGVGPSGITVSPDGKSAYVVNYGDNDVSQYDINPATGALSPKAPPVVATGSTPRSIAVTPDGKSAYVTAPDTGGPNSAIWQYDVNPTTGTLSPKSPSSLSAGANPWAIAITPDSKSAYVTLAWGTAFVSQFTIDSTTGTLSPKTPAQVPTGTFPRGIAVTPDGKSAYVTNEPDAGDEGDSGVSQYDIDQLTGTLSPKTPATVAAGYHPTAIAVTPDGTSAYVVNGQGNSLNQYTIDPTTGALSPKTPASVATDLFPGGIAVGRLPQGYPRPKGATPIRVPLVPAYNQCTSANRTHGSPLSFPSCAPPTQTSSSLTLGTPDANGAGANSTGYVRFAVGPGDPSTPADEADIGIKVSVSDVRKKSDLSDYTGQLLEQTFVRITDRNNGTSPSSPGGTDPATMQEINLPIQLPCAATASTTIGGQCTLATTMDAVIPGSVKESQRSIWQLTQVQVFDGGADGSIATQPNTLFMDQGLFIP